MSAVLTRGQRQDFERAGPANKHVRSSLYNSINYNYNKSINGRVKAYRKKNKNLCKIIDEEADLFAITPPGLI